MTRGFVCQRAPPLCGDEFETRLGWRLLVLPARSVVASCHQDTVHQDHSWKTWSEQLGFETRVQGRIRYSAIVARGCTKRASAAWKQTSQSSAQEDSRGCFARSFCSWCLRLRLLELDEEVCFEVEHVWRSGDMTRIKRCKESAPACVLRSFKRRNSTSSLQKPVVCNNKNLRLYRKRSRASTSTAVSRRSPSISGARRRAGKAYFLFFV